MCRLLTAGFQAFHKQPRRSIFATSSSSSSLSTPPDSHRSNSDALKLFFLVFHDRDKRSNRNYHRNGISLQFCVD